MRAAFAIPGDLAAPTGGYVYDRRVLPLLPSHGLAARHLALPGSFPDPSPGDLDRTFAMLSACPSDEILLIDGLAYGRLPTGRLRRLPHHIVALVHHPLALENGLGPEKAAEFRACEREALAVSHRVIATSAATARLLASDFAVPSAKLRVAEPGTDSVPRAVGSGTGAARSGLKLLGVGSIVPRKGYDCLIEALAGLRDLPWTLTIAGALDRSAPTLAALRGRIVSEQLAGRVELAGALDARALASAYATADVFVSSSLFEGYGMALTEAMAHGLPIVATTGGAAAETVPDHAALKVAPADVGALRQALRAVLTEPPLRRRLAEASWQAAQGLPTWDDTARHIAAACQEVLI